ncbi:hypothetical protein QZH56_23205 [Streptomyces olivoreticuli]|uniref:hypothetical protein n=1 Tax=Streptomyces olivoreticuli TaxID=68246 RepID=UPI00265AFB4B|nr:hypothetical protein [Streptomyces olivoreticuli]WKK21734.1 hypothetical protein QZH56_23205 [Streptomyces olivoreticuli]
MTYRNGVFVMDTREERIGQVIDSIGTRVQLREPGGGREWEVPFSALRLATCDEREVIGLWPQMIRPMTGCAECPELAAALREAQAGGDKLKKSRALVAQRGHWRLEHGL